MRIAQLSDTTLFKDLTQEELVQVAMRIDSVAFKKGSQIVEENTPGDKLYVIRSGEVRISKKIHKVGEEAFAFLHEGDFFGEMAFIDDKPRSATVYAEEKTECYVLSYENLRRLMAENSIIANKILWVLVRSLADRLRHTNDKISDFFKLAI
jgi:CRP-like cAMP-binding protein